MTNTSKIAINATKKIKSFQYLDTEKMYSISSQLFEGLTDYVLDSKHDTKQKSESQKGREWGSGRVLADIIEESSGTTEKRFLHDYSYTLFEEALIEADRVLDITEGNVVETIGSIDDKSFVKVTGKVLFNDTKRVIHSLDNFNAFGYAVWYITEGQHLEEEVKRLKEEINNIGQRDKKAGMRARLDAISKFGPLIQQAGLYMNPEYLKHMAYTLDYGYSGQFEVQLPMYGEDYSYLFSGILKREMLKENEDLLIKKYSRETEKKFTVFGIPTQTQGESAKLNPYREIKEGEDSAIKQAMINLVSQLTKVENSFTAKLSYEYVIDPIAIYVEI